MIAPTESTGGIVEAAGNAQAEIERLKLALISLQMNLTLIQKTGAAIGIEACAPLFDDAHKTISEALSDATP